jgi:hypothetical protein
MLLNIAKSVLNLMNTIENTKKLNGNVKKSIVLNEMILLLGVEKYAIYKTIIEEIIELIVSISKSDITIDINKFITNTCCNLL